MSRSKHKISRWVGEKMYYADMAARKVLRRTGADMAEVIAEFKEKVASLKAD